MKQDYLDQLAEFVVDTRWEDFDPTAIAAAKDVVLDTVGAILAAAVSLKTPTSPSLLRL